MSGTGPAGPAGTTISTSFAYTGCYNQTSFLGFTGSYAFDTAAAGVANTPSNDGVVINSQANPAARQCAQLCLAGSYNSPATAKPPNFFGIISVPDSLAIPPVTNRVQCWCGTYIIGSMLLESNCLPCSGIQGTGTCGRTTGLLNTAGISIAVYGRGF